MEGDGEDLGNEVASDVTAPAETNVEEVPQPPSANSVSAMTVPDSSKVRRHTPPCLVMQWRCCSAFKRTPHACGFSARVLAWRDGETG